MDALEILTYLVWLVASVTFIFALKFLASPRTARTGNLLGAGGGAAALVAVVEFLRDTELHPGELLPLVFVIATLLGAIIGSVSLTGSVVAFGKLQGLIAARPVKYPGSQFVTAGLFLAVVAIGVYIAAVEPSVPLFLLFVALSL